MSNYVNLVSKLSSWSHAYYYAESPIVSDAEYDQLFRMVADIEKANPHIIDPNSPTQKVGGERISSLESVKHKRPMLSLGNVFDHAETEKWCSDINLEMTAEVKLDGLAISLIYTSDGNNDNQVAILDKAITRGDGEVGENVLHNVELISNIPRQIPSFGQPEIEVRGEIVMTFKSFDRLNERLLEEGKKPMANPRNAAAGAIRLLDPKESKKRSLSFFGYSAVRGFEDLETHFEQMVRLREMGFMVDENLTLCVGVDGVIEAIDEIEAKRHSLPYPIDGVVIKVNNIEAQNRLGFLSRTPKFAVARKLTAVEKSTTLSAVDWQVGRTGALTPVARIEPVEVDGSVISNVTLHNLDQIEALGLKIGDRVAVSKAGDVIPQITAVMETSEQSEPVQPPAMCPSCGNTHLIQDGAVLRCTNKLGCQAQAVEYMNFIVGKDYLDMKGLGSGIIAALYENGLAKDPADLFSLNSEDILTLPKQGELSAKKVISAIERGLKAPLYKFVAALGISSVGRTAGKVLCKGRTLDEIMGMTKNELMALPDFGEVMADNIIEYFADSKNQDYIQRLRSYDFDFENSVEEESGSNELEGQVIVVTGSFGSIKRSAIQDKVESMGGKCSGSVSAKTTLLVAGEKSGSKLEKAEKLGVKVVGMEYVQEVLGISG